MEKLYSVDFFMSFIESLQGLCQQYLSYNQFVEVSGYVCVEIDNMKKERYVLSELLQSSGNVVSESYCTKSFSVSENTAMTSPSPLLSHQLKRKEATSQRNKENRYQSRQRTTVSSQPVFPSRSNSESMILPVHPVLDIENHPENSTSQIDSKDRIQARSTDQDFHIGQFNIQKPVPGQTEYCAVLSPEDVCVQPQSTNSSSKAKRRKHSSYTESTPLESPASASNQSYSSESEVCGDPVMKKPTLESSSEIQVTLPRSLSDDGDPGASNSSSVAGPEVIDLDMFEDGFENFPSDSSFQDQSFSDFKSDATFDVSSMVRQCQKKVVNPGSLSVLRSVVKRFKQYHFEKSGEDVDPVNTPPERLNEMLLDFFTGAKKMDGSDLTVGSLKNIQVYMERYLKQEGYPYSITRDDRFKPCRDYIKARQEESAKSKVVPKHVPINDDDIEMLFCKSILGMHTPDTLFNTLWLLNSKYFAKKKPGEHFTMKWGELQLSVNEAGEEFLERPINDAFSLKVFAKPQDPDRCFVNFYKQYRDMRPKCTLDKEFAFYLKLNKNPAEGLWFLPEPMMWSPFTYVWKKIVASSGLSANKKLI